MSVDITSSFSNASSIQRLVDLYLRRDEGPRDKKISEKNTIQKKKSVLSSLQSKLSSLKTKSSLLSDTVFNVFENKIASSSDSDKIKASASDTSIAGNHSLSVTRLATAHTIVSNQYTASSTSISSSISTDQTFSLSVAHPTNDDSDNRVNVDVTVSASSFNNTTNESVLASIANAINSAMSTAFSNDTIDSDEKVIASVVSEENGKARLLLKSSQTGYTYRQSYTDTSGLLSAIGLSTASQSSGTNGGYITSESNLNSTFTMDGLSFSRDSNQVNDILTGVTINLLQTFSSSETITIDKDLEGVKSKVKDFISKYNDAINFLNTNAKLDPETKARGVLANDSLYSGLISRIKDITTKSLSGVSNPTYNSLASIGITADRSGALMISDPSKFDGALEIDTKNISEVFNNSTDGITVKLEDLLESFTNADGSISSSQQRYDDNIIQINDQINRLEERLEKRRSQLTSEFAKMQEMMSLLSRQQSFMNQFFR